VAAFSAGTLKIWEPAGEAAVLTLRGHTSVIVALAFSPDGKRLASGGDDRMVHLWDVLTGEELLKLRGHTRGIRALAFRPDGRCLASADGPPFNSLEWPASIGIGPPVSSLRLWETAPPAPEVRLQRKAARLVETLFGRLIRKADVLAYLRDRSGLLSPLREVALATAERYAHDPADLYFASWQIVRGPDANAAAYKRALLQAQEACRLVRGNHDYVTTLAVARYRVGQYKAALGMLTLLDRHHSASSQGSQPVDLAFLAMTQHHLGQKMTALATWKRLQAVMKQAAWVNDLEAQAFFHEAEQVLQGQAESMKH
jgi:hypothetical protein